MKKLVLIVFVFCVAGFVFGAPLPDASDLGNAFHAFGNCEGGPIFVTPSDRGTIAGQSEDPSGAVNKCLKIVNDFEDRIEGSTVRPNITYAGLTGTDVNLSFYLKGGAGDKIYSYPRFAVRQNPTNTITYAGEVDDCLAYKEWTNTAWTFDSTWRQYSFPLTTLNFDSVTTGDFFTNDYFESTTQTLYLDEIVLRDPTPKDASDDPANAFASFGDCEALLWTQPCSLNTEDLTSTYTQIVEPGVVGNCVKVTNPQAWDRVMASTVDVPTDLLWGTDTEFQFYYKASGALGYGSSYPYVYLRQGVTDNNSNPYPPTGDPIPGPPLSWIHSEATSRNYTSGFGGTKLVQDDTWHLFKPDVTGFNWAGQNADMVLSHLGCDGCGNDAYFYIDEIYLTDPTPPSSRVNDWGLF